MGMFGRYIEHARPLHPPTVRRIDPSRDQDDRISKSSDADYRAALLDLRLKNQNSPWRRRGDRRSGGTIKRPPADGQNILPRPHPRATTAVDDRIGEWIASVSA